MIKLINRYMTWYENKEEKRNKAGYDPITNNFDKKRFLKKEMVHKMGVLNWVFSYQNIFTYLFKQILFLVIFFIGFSFALARTTPDLAPVVAQAIMMLFFPFFSFTLIGCAKGIKKGFLYMFPTCIVSFPIVYLYRLTKKNKNY